MMPFVRLIAIYIIVGLAVFAFFKRDALMALISGSEAEVVMVAEPVAEPVIVQPVAEPLPTPIVEPAPTPAAEPVFAPVDMVPPRPANPQDMNARLGEARQAFWDGDAVTAEFLYKGLANDFPTEAMVKGELGNLYYNTGRMTEAATQFHAVGLLSIEAGNTAQMMAMIGVLQSIAPNLAADLQARAAQQN
ncbi:MAG: hypothetical protein COA53_01605 [Rhodobacteraceae bacterium]|nr:MAG: hypothetical protein COA53_01605 [Paracoccaceae bacterium]